MVKVQYTDVEEPNFIRKFKKRVNYVEPTKVEEKLTQVESCSQTHDEYIKDDELPVVLMDDNTELDVTTTKALLEDRKIDTSKSEKILFKKPTVSRKSHNDKRKVNVKKVGKRATKNSKLLSFDDIDE